VKTRWLASMFLFAAAALCAQSGAPRGGEPMGLPQLGARKAGISRACIEALGLSSAQTAFLEQLRQNLASEVAPLFVERRTYRGEIEAALETSSPDPAAIGRLVIADHGVAERIRAAHDRLETAFQALLTPEQLANYTALRENGVCATRGKGPR